MCNSIDMILVSTENNLEYIRRGKRVSYSILPCANTLEEYRGQVTHYYIILHMNIPQTSSVVIDLVLVCVWLHLNKRVAYVIVVASTPVTGTYT